MNVSRRRYMGGEEKLPYDAEILYLNATQRQGILTKYIPKGDNIVIKTSLNFNDYYGAANGMFGNRNGDSTNFFGIRHSPDSKLVQYVNNNSRYSDGYTSWNQGSGTFALELSKNELKINNSTTIALNNVAGDENNAPLRLFSAGEAFSNGCMVGYFKYFRVEDNGVPVLDLIPVRVGQVGYMYDKVSKELFGNAGTGNFTLGRDLIEYENQYLTFVSLEDNNTISFKASSANILKTISVSTDGGKTWTEKTSSTSGTELATLNSGKKLLVKGTNTAYATSDSVYNSFSSTGYCDVEGNIQSLRYGDLFSRESGVSSYFATRLFNGFTKLKNAENLVLPTSVAKFCYQFMFYGCSSLLTAPYSLRATSLAQQCYHGMFQNCSSLKESPIIYATNLTTGLYGCNAMFTYCSHLERITCLATSAPSNNIYTSGWVTGVAANGTFVKNASATNWSTGTSGIPSGWTVIDAS